MPSVDRGAGNDGGLRDALPPVRCLAGTATNTHRDTETDTEKETQRHRDSDTETQTQTQTQTQTEDTPCLGCYRVNTHTHTANGQRHTFHTDGALGRYGGKPALGFRFGVHREAGQAAAVGQRLSADARRACAVVARTRRRGVGELRLCSELVKPLPCVPVLAPPFQNRASDFRHLQQSTPVSTLANNTTHNSKTPLTMAACSSTDLPQRCVPRCGSTPTTPRPRRQRALSHHTQRYQTPPPHPRSARATHLVNLWVGFPQPRFFADGVWRDSGHLLLHHSAPFRQLGRAAAPPPGALCSCPSQQRVVGRPIGLRRRARRHRRRCSRSPCGWWTGPQRHGPNRRHTAEETPGQTQGPEAAGSRAGQQVVWCHQTVCYSHWRQ